MKNLISRIVSEFKPSFNFKKIKFPIATCAISFLLILVYFAFSSWSLFMSDSAVYSLGLFKLNLQNIFAYLFVHVGIIHLVSNLVPFVIFGFFLENDSRIKFHDFILIFFLAGTVSGLLFLLFNQETMLIGASAAISGIVGACAVLRPKETILGLLFMPLFFFLFIPLIYAGVQNSISSAKQDIAVLNQSMQKLLIENKTLEASKLNESLSNAVVFEEQQSSGSQRENATPSDFMVHIYGLVVGVLYAHFVVRSRGGLGASRD